MPTPAEWLDQYNDMVNVFHDEPDRSAAILAVSVLESFLGDALRAILLEDTIVEELFRQYGPLSTFKGRIDMSFALGLITRHSHRDMNYLRKIRNHFAHHPGATSFKESPCREVCGQLQLAKPIPREEGGYTTIDDPRLQCLLTVGMAMLEIQQVSDRVERGSIPKCG